MSERNKITKNDLWKIIVFFFVILLKPDINAMISQEEIHDQVPEAVTTSGQFEKVIVVRIKQGADLLASLNSAVEKETIKNDTPVDLTSMNGYIFDGRVHAHINISDERLALGGHLEPGSEVFTFAIITIGIFNDEINLARFDDKNWR